MQEIKYTAKKVVIEGYGFRAAKRIKIHYNRHIIILEEDPKAEYDLAEFFEIEKSPRYSIMFYREESFENGANYTLLKMIEIPGNGILEIDYKEDLWYEEDEEE